MWIVGAGLGGLERLEVLEVLEVLEILEGSPDRLARAGCAAIEAGCGLRYRSATRADRLHDSWSC